MKKLLLYLILISITGCTTTGLRPPTDKGTSCAKMGKDLEETCIQSDTFSDPTRWHYLRPYERDALGQMPDL